MVQKFLHGPKKSRSSMVVARNPESWIIMKNIRREKGGSNPPKKKIWDFFFGGGIFWSNNAQVSWRDSANVCEIVILSDTINMC